MSVITLSKVGYLVKMLKFDPNLKFHRLSLLFPPMTDDELESLEFSLLQDGLKQPILVTNHKPHEIIDGRNRQIALKRIAAKGLPTRDFEKIFNPLQGYCYQVYEGDIESYSMNVNLIRRNLKPSQKGMFIAQHLLPKGEDVKPRGVSDVYGVNYVTIYKCLYVRDYHEKAAKMVEKKEPKLAEFIRDLPNQVLLGKLSVGAAEKKIRDVLFMGELKTPRYDEDKLLVNASGLFRKIREIKDPIIKDKALAQIDKLRKFLEEMEG